jgi:putative tryptophan/tyrosine transport system substrate-binding protein
MRRRTFITMLGGAAAWPLRLNAQRTAPAKRIGVVAGVAAADPAAVAWRSILERALQETSLVVGRDVEVEYRFTSGDVGRMHTAAIELVRMPADLLIASGTAPTRALQQQTGSIPIVFVQSSDPVGDGFVESLARPGRNITGFPNVEWTISGKWLELLKEIAPRTARVALLFSPENAPRGGQFFSRAAEEAAPSFGVRVISLPVSNGDSIEPAIADVAREANGGLIVMPDSFTAARREAIVTAADRHGIPAIYPYREFAEGGGLISYGANSHDLWRRAASYAARIFKGEMPADLPVQAPTKFELVINLKTADALGLDVPLFLQQRADEVIE